MRGREEIERLARLAETGCTMTQAARRLGVTKNTVAGMAWRSAISFSGDRPGHSDETKARISASRKRTFA